MTFKTFFPYGMVKTGKPSLTLFGALENLNHTDFYFLNPKDYENLKRRFKSNLQQVRKFR